MKIFLVKSRFFKTFMAVPVLCLAIACEDVTGYKDSPVDGYVSPKNFSVSTKQERMVYYVLRTITQYSTVYQGEFMRN